jgi:hypothetical protein
MRNPIRPYLYEIGKALGNLGYEFCQQANAPEPLNIHGQVKQAVDNLCYNLHNLSSDIDKWRKEMLEKDGNIQLPNIFEGTDGVDVESTYWAVHHLLHFNFYDVDLGLEYTISEELKKLEWLFEELQNTPDATRYSKAIQ